MSKKSKKTLLWYTFRQNNSGGYFTGPAHFVVVQASNAQEAIAIAERHDLYFDGQGDCSCCGSRWSDWLREGTPTPTNYGKPIIEYEQDKWSFTSENKDVPRYLIVFNDGSTLSGSAVKNNWTNESFQ